MGISFWNYLSGDMAIDLGTANTLIYLKGQDIVIDEPSIVARNSRTGQIIAVGDDAKEMLGKTHQDIEVIRPLKDGVIANFEVTEGMLQGFIKKVKISRIARPRMVIGVPTGITEVEKRAVKDSAERANAREVDRIGEPVAAATGIGLEIDKPVGSVVVEIGGGTTEIAVIALDGIVTHESVRIGGDEMDEAIVQYFKREHNLLIGERTAENIKCDIGSAKAVEEVTRAVKGRNLIAGIPKTIEVTSSEIREALRDTVDSIVRSVTASLEETPPELSSDILDRGIILTGGGALLKGLDQRLRDETELPVNVAENPLLTVAYGTGKVLENIEKYASVLT